MRNRAVTILVLVWSLSQAFATDKLTFPIRADAEGALKLAYTTNDPAQYERAALSLEQAVRQEPDLALRKSLAYVYLDKLKRPAAAYPHLEEVARQAPDPDWMLMLARAARETGRKNEAAGIYQKIAKSRPRDAWSRFELAKILRELKRPAEARAVLGEALRIDPTNNYARAELAAIELENGRYAEARRLVPEMKAQEPGSADAHALAGEILRKNWDLAGSDAEYRQTLEVNPTDVAARSGLQKNSDARKIRIGATYYQFKDSDNLQQRSLYTTATIPGGGRFSGVFGANWIDFEREPFGRASRIELAAGMLAHVDARLTLFMGLTGFETENLDRKIGFDGAAYYSLPAADFSLGYATRKPVNDSIQAVLAGLTQDVFTGSFTWRVWSHLVISGRGSFAEYADENARTHGIVSAGWAMPWHWLQRAAVEYQILEFSRQTNVYSSPDNEKIIRPVLQLSPRLLDWLTLELRGELPYLIEEKQWGHGISAGLRAKFANGVGIGVTCLRYELPGGQANWSGDGFKVEVNAEF